MARITTSKGEARLRPMLAKDELLIGELAEVEDAKDVTSYFKVKARMLRALDEATISADWEGGFGELPKDDILTALFLWNAATDEDAVPEESVASSETPTEAGD